MSLPSNLLRILSSFALKALTNWLSASVYPQTQVPSHVWRKRKARGTGHSEWRPFLAVTQQSGVDCLTTSRGQLLYFNCYFNRQRNPCPLYSGDSRAKTSPLSHWTLKMKCVSCGQVPYTAALQLRSSLLARSGGLGFPVVFQLCGAREMLRFYSSLHWEPN